MVLDHAHAAIREHHAHVNIRVAENLAKDVVVETTADLNFISLCELFTARDFCIGSRYIPLFLRGSKVDFRERILDHLVVQEWYAERPQDAATLWQIDSN